MFSWIKYFKAPTPEALRQRELADAERDAITSAKQAEYWAAMSRMNKERVNRLRNEVAADQAAGKGVV